MPTQLPPLPRRDTRRPLWLRAACAAILSAFVVTAAFAQSPAASGTGIVEGRVFNTGTGEYLEKARVTIEGTALETLTDATGQYAFRAVPAGAATVKVFYTGMETQSAVVNVSAGARLQRDFNLQSLEKRPAAEGERTVKLGEFVVTGSREMDGSAIAINEKRFASDIRNVIAADEFGPMADGNVGEILKSVPGVSIEYVGGAAMGIALNGVLMGYVPVTMNGFPLASTTASGTTARDVELINVATNNLSRIEVLYSPTPESPANALGGSVNMVPRGAFERSKPALNTNVYVLMRDDAKDLHRSPGPGTGYTYNVHPGFDFSYVAPVTKNFGFTLSGGTSQEYQPSYFVQTIWRGVSGATNGTTLPATTPDKPYLTDYLIRDLPRQSRRSSAGLTIDYRFSPADRISLSLQSTRYDAQFNERDLQFTVGGVPADGFTLDHTHGTRGAGSLTLSNVSDRDRRNANYTPSLVYRHDGPIWKFESGVGYSWSKSEIRDLGKGFFNTITATRNNVTINFDDIFYLRPRSITVLDGATGAAVSPWAIDTYTIQSASGNAYGANTVIGVGPGEGIASKTIDAQRNAYASLKRDFAWRVPVTLKAGLDVRESRRDYRGGTTAYTFLGADGRSNTVDDNAAQIYDEIYSQRDGVFGFPRTDRMSGVKLWDLFRAHPTWFSKNDATVYTSAFNLSKFATEAISSAYLRGDVLLLNNRLKVTGGVRAEQTNVTAQGPLTDRTRNFQHDSRGQLVLVGGKPVPITSDPLQTAILTLVDRGAQAKKEYLRYFPSVNLSYNLRENLIARASYYYSIGRPDYNQYAGGVTLPDTSQSPSPSNVIRISNAGIKAWEARSAKVSLEYYFEGVGLVSVGAFRRDFENFFGGTVQPATPELLALYGLDPAEFGGFDIATQYNLPGVVRMDGYDFQYKQALTFLPNWARGVQVFANAAATRATGPGAEAAFSPGGNPGAFIPRTYSWGVSLTRPKYSLRANWNYKGRHRRALQTGQSIGPSTYAWGSKRLLIDLIAEYKLTSHFSLFGNIRNLNDSPEDFPREGPLTPPVARFRQRDAYGALWIFGLKGTF